MRQGEVMATCLVQRYDWRPTSAETVGRLQFNKRVEASFDRTFDSIHQSR